MCANTGDRNIKALRVKCSYSDDGCEWTGEVLHAENHIAQCKFRRIRCPNLCSKKNGDDTMILLKDVQTHLEKECRRRLFQCPHCKDMGEYRNITGDRHLNVCPRVKVRCPNEGCGESIPRIEVDRHRSTCGHEVVSCKYEVVGCKVSAKRQEMEKHETVDPTHIVLAMEAVLKQQEKLKRLEGQVARASSFNQGRFTFKMASFRHYKTVSTLFFSPSFYTSPGGYKMCIRVVANGDGAGQDTHISVYAVVVRGDYDDNLEWPIKGTVTVELLNHLADDNHHAIRFTYPEGKGDVSTKRVTSGERAKRGYGKTRFIPHAELQYNEAKKCQYLKDDSLYFRVSVDTSSPKPWLACSI